jgi:hypothetical protein
MQQERKTPAFWERRPGVTLLIAGVLVYLAGEVADNTIVIAFGLFLIMLAGLVACLQIVRFMVREMTPRAQAENGADVGKTPAYRTTPVDEVLEQHRAGGALTTVAETRERDEYLRQFHEAVEREALRRFVEGTLAQKAIAEAGGLEGRRSALRKEVGALIEEFRLTHDPRLLGKVQALNRAADGLKP